jgi:hypothetical protein
MWSVVVPRLSRRPRVLVLAVLCLVYCGPSLALESRGEAGQQEAAEKHRKAPARAIPALKPLPVQVEEMRQALLEAARSGRIEELRVPLEWNELNPDVDGIAGQDPIAHLKKISGDGEGVEILAVLADILPMRPAELRQGKDIENNIVYVWPYLAEAKLDSLTPPEQVDLLRLVGPAAAKEMRDKKRWTWWRLAIGADGTWHSLKKQD